MDPIISELIAKTGEVAIRNTASFIYGKIQAVKAGNDDKKAMSELEELIRNLLDDKNDLLNVIKVYEEEFAAQKLNAEDLKSVEKTVLPALKEFGEKMAMTQIDEEAKKTREFIEMLESLKPLLSTNVLSVLQTVGFNYKKGIGEPLTSLANRSIFKSENQVSLNKEIEKLQLEREVMIYKIAIDPEATKRFESLIGKQ